MQSPVRRYIEGIDRKENDMPDTIHSAHIMFTLIATGILIGLGWALIHMAVAWPASRVAGGAAIICLLLLIIAYLI